MLTKVMIIRHAEKPDKEGRFKGVTAEGKHDDGSLTVHGWQRAGALATFFSRPDVSSSVEVPAAIYASGPDSGSGSSSKRPIETITPLAAKLPRTPVVTFSKGAEAGLAQAVLGEAGVILIAWQHERILSIVGHLIRGAPLATPLPTVWPDDRFDMDWILSPPEGGSDRAWQFKQVPQLLLASDSETLFP